MLTGETWHQLLLQEVDETPTGSEACEGEVNEADPWVGAPSAIGVSEDPADLYIGG